VSIIVDGGGEVVWGWHPVVIAMRKARTPCTNRVGCVTVSVGDRGVVMLCLRFAALWLIVAGLV
jgi:hypothetical protein